MVCAKALGYPRPGPTVRPARAPGAPGSEAMCRSRLIARRSSPSISKSPAPSATALRAGSLTPETKLPATRELARRLGVHRQTIVEAYRLLASEGHVRAGVGAGTFVAAPGARAPGETRTEAAAFAWRQLLRDPRLLEDDPTRFASTRSLRVPQERDPALGSDPRPAPVSARRLRRERAGSPRARGHSCCSTTRPPRATSRCGRGSSAGSSAPGCAISTRAASSSSAARSRGSICWRGSSSARAIRS